MYSCTPALCQQTKIVASRELSGIVMSNMDLMDSSPFKH